MTDNPAIEAMAIAIVNGDWDELPELHKVLALAQARAALTAYHEHLAAAQRDNLTTLQTHLNLGTFDRYPNVEKAIAAMIAAATPPTT